MRLFQAIITAALLASPLACNIESSQDKYMPDELAEFKAEHKDDADALKRRLDEAQAQRGDSARKTLSRIERDIERDRREQPEQIAEKLEELDEPVTPYGRPNNPDAGAAPKSAL